MAAKKITEYTADASPTSDDLVLTVNDPGGSPANRKVTLANLYAAFASWFTTVGVAAVRWLGGSAPSTPAAGSATLYAKTSGGHTYLYLLDETGTEYELGRLVYEAVTGGFPTAAASESVLKNTLADGNVLSLRNLDTAGYSALTARTADGHEVLAMGYGNPAAFAVFADANYIQSWSGISGAGNPKRFILTMDGNYGPSGSGFRFYVRQSLETNGDIKFWQLLPSSVTQKELVHIDAVNNRVLIGYNAGNSPEQLLHLVDGAVVHDEFGADAATYLSRNAGGSASAKTQTAALTSVISWVAQVYTDAGVYTGNIIAINGVAVDAPTSAARGSRIDMRVTPVGTTTLTTVLQILGTGITSALLATLQKVASPAQTSTATGTQNAFAVTSTFIRLNNATDITINGIAAGVDGQIAEFTSVGAGNCYFAHASGSASAADRLTNRVTSGVTPVAAGKGSIRFRYDGTTSTWRLLAHDQGDYIAIPFVAGDFTANGSMTWTVASGDVVLDKYMVVGRALQLHFRYITTTVGGSLNSTLLRLYPNGYTAPTAYSHFTYGNDNGTVAQVHIGGNSTSTTVSFVKADGTNWSAATDNTAVRGQVTIPLT